MFSVTFFALLSGMLLSLRLGPAGGTFPKPLPAEEERELVAAWVNHSDLTARNRLVEHNLRLVAHIIKKYYAQNMDQDDLISIGSIGLIKGINTYRPEKNVRLATYASRCIENEILMYFRSRKKSAGDVSLSDTVESEGDGENLSILDVVAEDSDLLETISRAELGRQARELVNSLLEPREGEILRLRYGLSGKKPLTQRETAEICGISRSYVSRIEKRDMCWKNQIEKYLP